jgi:hypothetical protein
MMTSIPNMRSAPLPVPTPKGPLATDTAPGDFAAQMPGAPGQPAEAVALLPEAFVDPLVPSESSPEGVATDEADDAPDEAGTPGGDQPAPALVIPFLPTQPVIPGPQVRATVSATGDAPADPALEPVPAGKFARPARGTGGGKTGLPDPAAADAAIEPAIDPEMAAAVKELIQRKQALAKQAGAASAKEARLDAAKPEAATPAPAQGQAPSSAGLQASAPLPAADLPQPVLAALDTQPAPAKASAAAAVDGTRTTDLALERQLDLARDGEWLDRLARDIARAGANDSPLRFRLHPQTLGSLHVELQRGDHGTAVRLTVETEAARQILSDAQPRLAAEARAQGVRIAETHVDLSGSGRHAPGDQRRQDEARQTPLIRTARGSDPDAAASARSSGRARLDRYA